MKTEEELLTESWVDSPADYEFAFAAVAKDLDSVSEEKAAEAVRYDSSQKCTAVRYAGDTGYTRLESGEELYFVYFRKMHRRAGRNRDSGFHGTAGEGT